MNMVTECFIIVKYATMYFPNGFADYPHNVSHTHSWKAVGLAKHHYPTKEDAQEDLGRLLDFNPTACYGIVKSEIPHGH